MDDVDVLLEGQQGGDDPGTNSRRAEVTLPPAVEATVKRAQEESHSRLFAFAFNPRASTGRYTCPVNYAPGLTIGDSAATRRPQWDFPRCFPSRAAAPPPREPRSHQPAQRTRAPPPAADANRARNRAAQSPPASLQSAR